MLLTQETTTRFGYDGTQFGPTSKKPVIVRCDVCGVVRESYARAAGLACQACACALKPGQRKESRKYASPTGLRSEILVAETIAAFGYDPAALTKGSARKVLRKCVCGEIKTVPFRYSSLPCVSCSVHSGAVSRREANRGKGLSARGLPLGLIKINSLKYRAAWERERYQEDPLFALKRRMYASLRAMLQHGYSSRYFVYTARTLRSHLAKCLAATNGNCPLCGVKIDARFHIDHKVPLCKAKNEQEIFDLFALKNLWVTCVDCNVRYKRARSLDEIVPKGGATTVSILIGQS